MDGFLCAASSRRTYPSGRTWIRGLVAQHAVVFPVRWISRHRPLVCPIGDSSGAAEIEILFEKTAACGDSVANTVFVVIQKRLPHIGGDAIGVAHLGGAVYIVNKIGQPVTVNVGKALLADR